MKVAWRVNLSSDALRFLSNLSKPDAKRIVEKLELASADPQRFFSRLSGRDDYKFRVGGYRVIALLLHAENIVFVEKIGHRKNVYK